MFVLAEVEIWLVLLNNIITHLLFEDAVCVEECEDEAAADDDPGPVFEYRLDQDDEKEGDVLLAGGHNRFQLRVGVKDSGPSVVILRFLS